MKGLLLSLIIFSSLTAHSKELMTETPMGDGAGNGGDVAICEFSDSNSFEGMYTLDYLLTYQKRNENRDVDSIEMSSWRDYADAIHQKLMELAPEMALNFKEFIEDTDNYTDESRFRIWRDASHGLIDIQDEGMFKKLPDNCRTVRQAVIRVDYGYSVEYYFDTDVEQQLVLRPLQYSMLMLHEFARDYTNETRAIRRFVRYLHSESFLHNETLTAEQFSRILKKMTVITVEEQTTYTQEEIDQNFLNDIRLNNMDYVKHWLKLGADALARDEKYNTALINAAISKNVEMVKLAIELGCFPGVANNSGYTALHFAAQSGSTEMVKLLLDLGSDATKKTDDGVDPLGLAIEVRDFEIAKLLVEYGADINVAAIISNRGVVEDLFDDYNFDRVESAKMLLELGWDVNSSSLGDFSPLIYALGLQDDELTHFLIENGADLSDDNVFHYPLERNHVEMVRYLIDHGATIEDTGLISYVDNPVMLDLVIEAGIDVNAFYNGVPLIAHFSFRPDLGPLLVQRGADVNVRFSNNIGENITPLMQATSWGNEFAVKLLISSGADLNATSASGNTALHYIFEGQEISSHAEEIIKLLFLGGLDRTIKNDRGMTALDMAIQRGANKEIIEALNTIYTSSN